MLPRLRDRKLGEEKILAVLGGRTSFLATYRKLEFLSGASNTPPPAVKPALHLPSPTTKVMRQQIYHVVTSNIHHAAKIGIDNMKFIHRY